MLLFSAIYFHSATEIGPYSLYRKKVISAFNQRKMMICLLQALSGLEKATISIQCVCAHALERGLMMQKLCTVGIRNAILRNQSYLDCEALHQQLVNMFPQTQSLINLLKLHVLLFKMSFFYCRNTAI